MNLEIIDRETRLRVEMIRTYSYAQYTDELSGDGKFQINIPISDAALPYLVRGNYIIFEEGVVGIILGVKDVQDEERQITVTGKLTNSILTYRSILKTERHTGKIVAIARTLLQDHFISPKDPKRKIELVTLASLEQYIPDSPQIAYCDTGTTVRESITAMFMPHNYGFELYPIIREYNEDLWIFHNLEALEFRAIKPVDRTIDNPDGNTPVVFSFQLSNLSRLDYEEDGSSFCSVAIVASEGVGQQRKTLEVGELEATGFDRIELYVDARDIQSEDGEGNSITEDELFSLMKQRGLEKLEGHKVFTTFDGNVLVSGDNRYIYHQDFYKGDYVSIIDDTYRRVFNLQVTSITKSISQGIEYFDIGFGLDKTTVKSLINTSTSTGGGVVAQGNTGGGTGEATTITVSVNETLTGKPGTNAIVNNVGDAVNVRLNFTIPRGSPGRDGQPGADGAQGDSAYEIAVQNGFNGTEQEWLESLKGEPGAPGPAGTYDILNSSSAVKENMEAGKIVDALVIKEVFQSVSEGKSILASAITDKGVPTDASETFQGMAENILAIVSGSGDEGGLEGTYTMYSYVSGAVKSNQNVVKTITLEEKYKCALGILVIGSSIYNPVPALTLNNIVNGDRVWSNSIGSFSLIMLLALDVSIAELEPGDQYKVNYSFNANSSSNEVMTCKVLLIK